MPNPTGVCWLLHVRQPAAAAAILSSTPLVRFAAGNVTTGLVYAETRWPPVRATAFSKLLDSLLVKAERKPTAMHRDSALLSIEPVDWQTGRWDVGGQGRRTDRLRPRNESEDVAAGPADASE